MLAVWLPSSYFWFSSYLAGDCLEIVTFDRSLPGFPPFALPVLLNPVVSSAMKLELCLS